MIKSVCVGDEKNRNGGLFVKFIKLKESKNNKKFQIPDLVDLRMRSDSEGVIGLLHYKILRERSSPPNILGK